MKNFTLLVLVVLITLFSLTIFVEICEARGGRGRGGGSFGGIFGGWRKYKKPASNSNSRRTINGSPMHTTGTQTMGSGSSHSSSSNSMKQQASYPKQQAPLGSGHNSYGGYYGSSSNGVPPMPPGSTYYPNTAAIPQGAIYYAQPPMYSSSGTGNFLVGMLAGHMASNLLLGPHHHVTHIYQQNPDQTPQSDPKIIVVNNGEPTVLNSSQLAGHSSLSSPGHWPTDTDTPLEPFNETLTPHDAIQSGKNPIFQRIKFNNSPNALMNQAAQQPVTPSSSSSPSSPAPPTNGIICMPVLLNETNPNDPSQVHQVERVICFPAPPPPSSTSNVNCITRTILDTDPNDPSKTIEVEKQMCHTPKPRQVAGEIGESDQEKVDESFSMENEEVRQDVAKGESATEDKVVDAITESSTIPAA